MKRLHFVSSGNAAVPDKPFADADRNEWLKKLIKDSNTKNHDLTFLFNAYTEKTASNKMGAWMKSNDVPVYIDSGGLQVITLGKPLTPEVKQQVYDIQAVAGDYGFCFDEIPVNVPTDGSKLLGMENRFFDESLVEPCAIKTAHNINNQIETFIKKGSSCKPIAIIQGNCYDSFMKWGEVLEKHINDDYKPLIGGIAMAGTSLGRGMLEDLEKAFHVPQLPISFGKKHLHLLAVGSVRRLAPTLLAMQTGYYPKDMFVSYDASTMSKHLHVGIYHNADGRLLNIKRQYNHNYKKVHDLLMKQFPDEYKLTIEDLFEFNNTNMTTQRAKGREKEFVDLVLMRFFGATRNFINLADKCLEDKDSLFRLFHETRNKELFDGLYETKNHGDFMYWLSHVRRYIVSNRIPKVMIKPTDLESFYG